MNQQDFINEQDVDEQVFGGTLGKMLDAMRTEIADLKQRVKRLERAESNGDATRPGQFNTAECSTGDGDVESASSQVYPGWPPAKPQPNEPPWPRYGAPHPSARGGESGD